MRRSSTQVLITHKTPAVVQANVLAFVATISGLPVAVAGPTYIRETAVLEFYSTAESNDALESLNELVELFCEESLATTTVIAFVQEEETRP